MAHDAHGLPEGGAQHWLAQPTGDACDEAARIVQVVVARPHDAAGQHQAPGRCVDEQRLGIAQMRCPIAPGDLVGDQFVGGRIVRNAQQRLGEAHENHAFLRRQIVLPQEGVEAAAFDLVVAHAIDQLARLRGDALLLLRIQPGAIGAFADDLLFITQIFPVDLRRQWSARRIAGTLPVARYLNSYTRLRVLSVSVVLNPDGGWVLYRTE